MTTTTAPPLAIAYIDCPGKGCGETAWVLPDGAVYCPRIGTIVTRAPGLPPLPERLSQSARRALDRAVNADWCSWCGPTHEPVVSVVVNGKATGWYCCPACWTAGALDDCDPNRPPQGVAWRGECGDPACAHPPAPSGITAGASARADELLREANAGETDSWED
jgi:hypothetical protein